ADLAAPIGEKRLAAGPHLDGRTFGGDGRQGVGSGPRHLGLGGTGVLHLGRRRRIAGTEHAAHGTSRKRQAQRACTRHAGQAADIRYYLHSHSPYAPTPEACASSASRMAGAPLTVTPASSCTKTSCTTPLSMI